MRIDGVMNFKFYYGKMKILRKNDSQKLILTDSESNIFETE